MLISSPVVLRLATVMLLSCTGVAAAQDRPNLSGRWLSEDGQQLTIEVEPRVFTVTEPTGRGMRRLIYSLDGSYSHNETYTAGDELWMQLAQARWVENAVLITAQTTRTDYAASWEWIRIYHLTSANKLSVTLVDKALGMTDAMVMVTTSYDRQE